MKLFAATLLACGALVAGSLHRQPRFARNDHEVKDFTGHKMIRILPSHSSHVDFLHALEHEYEMDYWNHPMSDLRPVLTVVDPAREKSFLKSLNSSSINYEVLHHNYQTVVDNERAEMIQPRNFEARDDSFNYNIYHTYDEIKAQIKFLADKYPTKAKYEPVGTTFENREIPAIVLGKEGAPVIFFECGIHSREWVTIAFATWVTNELLSNPTLANFLDNYQFVIVPVLNVDGFVFTHTSNRLWRKTRSTQTGTTCIGADPNRNWDSAFCEKGASSNPCSETYCGKSAFSETEALQMSKMITKYNNNGKKIAAYFAIHSYSQLWMYPFGYKYDNPPNVAKLNEISDAALTAIKAVNGLVFTRGSIANTIYLASGSSADWAYDTEKVAISFAVELRDKGQYGFQLPANQIAPACAETWAGLKAAINTLS